MRLIDATTLELCNFIDESRIPPYAILSHTWSTDEVTLQQFTDSSWKQDESSLKSSHGYWKIIKACQQALGNGLSLVWVDTCCIDKTSSAELSEAINSMFRWYKMAHACYAYLDDVNVHPNSMSDEGPIDHFSDDELTKSRWFTRGWTLQELIAPKYIVFYGKGWRRIGDKSLLCKTLERITGISARVLGDNTRVSDESIAKRMSWMAQRKTTRTEDIAYSLMGIFDVNMPLLYGEGDKAFIRLQEEIMKNSADHSLFAWDDSYYSIPGMPASVFASHPCQFKASSGITSRRFDDKDRLEDDFSCTNRGVKIRLRIRRHSNTLDPRQDMFLAVLDCCFEDPRLQNCWPAIRVRRLTGSKSQYVRLARCPIIPVVFGEVSIAQKQVGVISVGQADAGEIIYLRKSVPMWFY